MAAAQKVGVDSGLAPLSKGVHRIEASDAQELYWYFSDPLVAGMGGDSGSGFGAILARAELFAVRMRPCKRCGGDPQTDKAGTGFQHKDGKRYATELKRFQKTEAKRMGLRLVDAGSVEGWRALGIPAATAEQIAEQLPDKLTRRCKRCAGEGLVAARPPRSGVQTARPTGSSKQGGGHGVGNFGDETALQRYGWISRMLSRVHQQSAEARAALGCYYAPGSEGIAGLWPLTPSGKGFFLSLENPHNVSPDELLHSEREAQRQNPKLERTMAFAAIARETAELWSRACYAWNQARKL